MRRLFFLIFICLQCSPEYSSAQNAEAQLFSESMAFYKAKNFGKSIQILIQLVKSKPKNSLYWFNLGNCAYMTAKYVHAQNYFKKVISLKSPLSVPAQLYLAKSFVKLGQPDNASAILEELRLSRLPPAILQEVENDLSKLSIQIEGESLALANYQKGNYQLTENDLKKIDADNLSIDGRMLLGLTLIKQRKRTEAETAIQDLLRIGGLPSPTKEAALELLKKLRNNDTPVFPYWLFLDVSYGTNTNIYADGKSQPAVSSALTRGTIGFGYHFNQEKKWSTKLGYLLAYEQPQEASDLKILTQTIQSTLLYQRTDLDLSVTPYLQSQIWDDTPVSQRLGALLRGTTIKSNYELGIDLDTASTKSVSEDYSYLSGSSLFLKPYIGYWGQKMYFQFYYLLGTDGTQDIVYSDGSRLPLQQNYHGPGVKIIWKFSNKTAILSAVNYIVKDFKNTSLPEEKSRKDSEIGATLKWNYLIRPQISVYGLAEYIVNTSTLGANDVRDKNYQISIFSAGLSWEAF